MSEELSVWVGDRGFDLGWHVPRAALLAPGGNNALAELVGQEMSRRLDRSRPLWELTVIEGLGDGRIALLAKLHHHALVDGVAAVDIATVLLDPSPEPLDIPGPDEPWQARGYDRHRSTRDSGPTAASRLRRVAGRPHGRRQGPGRDRQETSA